MAQFYKKTVQEVAHFNVTEVFVFLNSFIFYLFTIALRLCTNFQNSTCSGKFRNSTILNLARMRWLEHYCCHCGAGKVLTYYESNVKVRSILSLETMEGVLARCLNKAMSNKVQKNKCNKFTFMQTSREHLHIHKEAQLAIKVIVINDNIC